MLFAHMADLHIGGWSDPKMTKLGLDTFRKAIDVCIDRKVDFILFSGDLFNTALPQIDYIKDAVVQLKRLKDAGIPSYIIPGSHDFSPSGKTMLDVLEKAGLVVNVVKFEEDKLQFTTDSRTGVKITGLLGRKGGLDKLDYEKLSKNHLEAEQGFKVFMFHTAIEEFLSEDFGNMESIKLEHLPSNFDYYAGGHVHYILEKDHDRGKLVYPGALFPNNFKELEKFKHGGFYLVDSNLGLEYVPINIKDVRTFRFDATGKTPMRVKEEILEKLNQEDLKDKIVLFRVSGALENGKPSDIKFSEIFDLLKGSYFVAKNISKLTTKEISEIKVEEGDIEDIESRLIEKFTENEHADIGSLDLKSLMPLMVDILAKEKNEAEKVKDYEKRILAEMLDVLRL